MKSGHCLPCCRACRPARFLPPPVRRAIIAGLVLGMVRAGGGPLPAQNLGFSVVKALNSGANTDAFADMAPSVASDGAGTWVAVWSSTNWLAGTIGTDRDLLFARSTTNGASWTTSAALNSEAGSDALADDTPSIAADRDGDGVWMVAWVVGNDVLISRSDAGSATWSAQAPLSGTTLAGFDSMVQLACDGADTWIAVWTSTDTLGETVGNDNDILFSRSTDDGATWSPAAALDPGASSDTLSDTEPVLAADGAGNWVAVWTVQGAFGNDADLLVSRSTDNGTTWSAPAPLNSNATTDGESDARATLATDGAGVWGAAWVASYPRGVRPTDNDIMFARSTDDGATWTELAPLNPNAPGDTGTDDSPRLACSGGGEWLAVWISTETFNGRLGSDLDVLVSRGLGAGLHWTHPMPLTNYARTDTGSDFRPFAAGDGAGAWVVVWSSLDPLVNQVGTDEDILTVNTPLIRLKLGGPLVR